MPSRDAPTLPADVAELGQGGVMITAASRDERLVASIAPVVGCRVNERRDEVTIYVFADAAEALARDATRQRQIAVAFSEVATHRTVQLKGRDVSIVPTGPADVALVRRYLTLYAAALRPYGWNESMVQAALGCERPDLLALRFTPSAAYHQTPGPGAGRVLALTDAAPSAPAAGAGR